MDGDRLAMDATAAGALPHAMKRRNRKRVMRLTPAVGPRPMVREGPSALAGIHAHDFEFSRRRSPRPKARANVLHPRQSIMDGGTEPFRDTTTYVRSGRALGWRRLAVVLLMTFLWSSRRMF